jgi:flagellar capping protein FliD
MPTIDGLVSGIDTTTIVEGLVQIQEQQVERLNSKIDQVSAKQAAFKGIEASLLTFQSSLGRLARIQNNAFSGKIATSSNEDIIQAAASEKAAPGTYNIRVDSLARSHQIASQGFADPDTTITEGDFSIQIGNGTTTTVTIDESNNTVRGLADAINNSGAGVSASIINDGTGNTPYRLLLTAEKAGTSNQITLSSSLAASNGNAFRPRFSESQIGNATFQDPYSGTASVSSNSSSTAYAGSDDDAYTFTINQSGVAGLNEITIDYIDGSGENNGTLTFSAADVNSGVAQTVAEGVEITLGAGTVVAVDQFTVDVFAASADVQSASDATVTIGSGAGAISVSSETNQIEDLISGVTVDIASADPTKDVSLTISNDTTAAKDAVTEFVSAFNGVIKSIDDRIRFDSESGQASALQGNRSVISIQDRLRSSVLDVVEGVNGQLDRLTSLGIKFNDQGQLSLDSGKLDDVLNGRADGVSVDDVKRLFALDGVSDIGGIEFVLGSGRTVHSATPYQVDITQAAERASITASNDLSETTVITSSNNTFGVSLDGKASASLTLAEGSYTRTELADHLESVINSDSELVGREVAVAIDGNSLKVTSLVYGVSSNLSSLTGTSLGALGFDGSESDTGQNVAGKFMVNGQEETATGNGRLLIGSSVNENTADLQVRVTLSASQVQAGVDGNVTVSRGIGARLDEILGDFFDPTDGRIKTLNDGFDAQIELIRSTITKQNALVEQRKESLIEQFVALESTINKLQSTGSFLAAQFAS